MSGERTGEADANPVAAALLAALKNYGFVAAPLLEFIDAHGFDLYGEPMANVGDLELYGIQTQSPLLAIAAGILVQGSPLPETFTLDASVAMALGKILTDLPRHASRRQLYIPLDVVDRHRVEREAIFAGQATDALRAALAEMRGLARGHLAKARETLRSAPPQVLPAFLSIALIEPTLSLMDRADYEPFKFQPLPAWRRQWLIWRAARNPARIFGV